MPAKHLSTVLGDGPSEDRLISNAHLLPHLREKAAFPRGDGFREPMPHSKRTRARAKQTRKAAA